jgi:hypothetical protein
MGFRNAISATADSRSVEAAAIPLSGVGNSFPLVLCDVRGAAQTLLLACANALVLDYVLRQKAGGGNLNFFIFKQLPFITPDGCSRDDLDFVAPRVLELTYTAHDMSSFAQDMGYTGPPFRWDGDRRAHLRAELDAYYAKLYGLTRKQLRYILDPHSLTDHELENILDPTEDPPDAPRTKDFPGETFRVLKEKEIKQFGEYRTQRLVLEAWDRLSNAR